MKEKFCSHGNFSLAKYTQNAYIINVEFIETNTFNKQITELLSDDEFMVLQAFLIANPKAGIVIPGGNGLRKLRWSVGGRGKRGGIRVIYYILTEDILFLLLAYAKNRKADLSKAELDILVELMKKGD